MWSLGILSPALGPLLSILLAWVHSNQVNLGQNSWEQEYDYIVVGAGSAGSVVANRLSEDPDVKVLLLEAGGGETLLTELPFACGAVQKTEVDWAYETEPQENACMGMIDRRSAWPRGKVLGGSSSINFMLYVRGNKRDYDRWAKLGCDGWGWEDVFPYFLKSEDNRDEFYAKNGFHATGGYQTVSTPQILSSSSEDFVKAGQYLGYPVGDYNGPVQSVFSHPQGTIRDGLRCSTAKSFLLPASKRKNLHIVTKAHAYKILIRERNGEKEAYGIQFKRSDKLHEVYAREEVISSAGSINSAQLLMLSGIGPAEHLQSLNIPVVADLPVGNNLQDHIYSGVYVTTSPIPGDTKTIANITMMKITEFLQDKTGPISTLGGVEAFGFIKTNYTDKYDDWPDFQIHMIPQAASQGTILIKHAQHLTAEYILKFVAPYALSEGTFLFPVMLRPESRGFIRLRSTDPSQYPIIDPRYYSHPDDIKKMVQAMRLCIALIKTPPMQRHKARLFKTIVPTCKQFKQYSDEYLACHAQTYTSTLYHPVGTARMGPVNDSRTVLDPQLRVKGVKRLRVVDASIMPYIVGGNTNAPTIMIGEKASDMIKAAYRERRAGK